MVANNGRCKTKKELKTKVGKSAYTYLEETSMFGDEILPNARLAIVGPGAYQRKWYATVVLDENCYIKKVT